MRQLRQDVGIVFQSYNLFPHLTVKQNITLALKHVKKLPKQACAEKADQVLKKVGLSEKADSYPEQLSGGQQQRVAIARRSEEHTSELQSLMRISYAVFCLNNKNNR